MTRKRRLLSAVVPVVAAVLIGVGLVPARAGVGDTLSAYGGYLSTAYNIYNKLLGNEVSVADALEQITAQIEQVRTEVLAEVGRLAAGQVKSCTEDAVINLDDLDKYSPDVSQQFALNATKCVTDAKAGISGVSELAAADVMGTALNAIGPIALIARAHAGLSTGALRQSLIIANQQYLARITPKHEYVLWWGDGYTEYSTMGKWYAGSRGYDGTVRTDPSRIYKIPFKEPLVVGKTPVVADGAPQLDWSGTDTQVLEAMSKGAPIARAVLPQLQLMDTPTVAARFQSAGHGLAVSSVSGVTEQLTQQMAANSTPAVAALPTGGFVTAFQAPDNNLAFVSPTGAVSGLGLGMAAGTSPSIAVLPDGSWTIAFIANNGRLWTRSANGTGGPVGPGAGLLADDGSSPAISVNALGGWVIAYQSAEHLLVTVTSSGAVTSSGLGMDHTATPAVTRYLPGGFKVAFRDSHDGLWTYDPITGGTDLKRTMDPNGNPAITTLSDGKTEIAYGTSDYLLATVSPAGAVASVGLGIVPGTSPAITATAGGAFVIVAQGQDGHAWQYPSTTGIGVQLNLTLDRYSSPAVTASAG
ncbi:hypothetical protein [Paractinoplanes toevensis]|uniref:hypothetical protein n=1 Tax=Paractinoplanes toevensis TaxID=571911 RepID=UPI001BB3792A|nr:hypothetical protein [Actinoplanes toevensis]